jgi:3-oxoacyl-[acyl-carrier protein] reductase
MRNVIVTGGSRGIGLAIARRLCACGYCCIVIARHESEGLSSAIQEYGRALQFRPFDLSAIPDIPELVRSIRKECGPIYGLVNNAAAGGGGILSSTQNSTIESMILLNTVSPIIFTKYVVRSMMAGDGGRIVNIASIVGSTGFSGLSVYAATKASIVGFTKSLARELGPLNINVNAIAPGFVDSDMTGGLGKDQRDKVLRRSPLLRLAEAGDVANAAEFLLGDSARNITGTVLTVDAGSTA